MILRRAWNALVEPVLHCLFPSICLRCGAPLFGSLSFSLCAACCDAIGFLGEEACGFCGAGTGEHAHLGKGCAACRRADLAFTRATAVATFDSPVRELVHDLKFRGNRRLARPMGEMMARRAVEADFPPRVDAVIPVPLHPKRLRERGYNQAELLARGVASSFEAPLRPRALRRIKETHAQALLPRRERLANPVGAFAATGRHDGETILLVDDVLTTGSTVSECAAVLRDAGARRVYVLVFAR